MGLSLALLVSSACAGPSEDQAKEEELIVFSAASMTEVMTQLSQDYMAENDIRIINSFDSSGTLKTQIEEGAPCDLFISASKKQMDALEDGGLIRPDSRADLLENKVVLAVAEDNPAGLRSYQDLVAGLKAGDLLLAMGNADVPVGQYTSKILEYFSLDEEKLAKKGVLSYASNVKEVTTQLAEETVDAGVIYATDARAAGLSFVDEASPQMAGQVIYPLAILKDSQRVEAAQAFMDYLTGPRAAQTLTDFGFTPLAN